MKKILLLIMMLVLLPGVFALSRSINPSSVSGGNNVVVTISGGAEFNGIIEQLPSGSTLVSGDNANKIGNELRAYFTSSTYSYTIKAPTTEGQYSITGVYEATGDLSGAITGDSSITVTSDGNGNGDDDGFTWDFFGEYTIWIIIGVIGLFMMMMLMGGKKK